MAILPVSIVCTIPSRAARGERRRDMHSMRNLGMIPKKPVPNLIPGYRFSEKHALGLDPEGSCSINKVERDGDSKKVISL